MSDSHPDRSGARRWRAGFWSAFVVSLGLAATGLFMLAKWIHPAPVYWLGARYDMVDAQLARIGSGASDLPRVAYFGDSTVASYEHGPSLPEMTERQLTRLRGERWVRVVNASAAGAGVTQYAFLSDRVASRAPDVIIWQISFFQLTDRWTGHNGAPELVGFVDLVRLPALLTMPFERFRLSLADILLQQTIVRSGLHDLHRFVRTHQIRFAYIRDLAEDALNPNRGLKPEERAQKMRGRGYLRRHIEPGVRARYSAYGEHVHFGPTLHGLDDDDALLQLLGWGIRPFTERGTDVLVYLNPTNLENLKRVGVYDEAGIKRTVEAIRRTVEANGGHFLDLHDTLSDEAFKDAPGHFAENEARDVPRLVVARIAEALLPILKARREFDGTPDVGPLQHTETSAATSAEGAP